MYKILEVTLVKQDRIHHGGCDEMCIIETRLVRFFCHQNHPRKGNEFATDRWEFSYYGVFDDRKIVLTGDFLSYYIVRTKFSSFLGTSCEFNRLLLR